MSGDNVNHAWRPSTPARSEGGDEASTAERHPTGGDPGRALRRLASAGDRAAAHLWLATQPDLLAATPDPADAPVAEIWRAALRHHLAGEPHLATARLATAPIGATGPHAVQLYCHAAVHHLLDDDIERASTDVEEAARAAHACGVPTAHQAYARVVVLLAAATGDAAATRGRVEATDGLRRADAGLFRLMVHLDLAGHLLWAGDAADALRHAEAAVRLTEVAGDTGFEPYALTLTAVAKCQLGRLEEALADGAAGLRLRELAGVAADEAISLAALGMVHRRRREPRQARQALESALAAVGSGQPRIVSTAWVLAELARIRAADDLCAAQDLAERAVTMAREPERPYALLARGWVALLRGDTVAAHFDAAEARTGATVGRRRATLVEALQLTVLAADDPRASAGLLDDAAALCRELGDPAEEATVQLIAARLQGRQARRGAEGAEQKLRRCGVRLDPGVADGLTAITLRVPAVVIHTLGDFRVFRAGAVVPYGEWQSKKARDLLKILVAHRGRAVPRARLMELLWPDESPSRTANRLSVLLSTLRRVLGTGRRTSGRGAVLADRGSVAIDLDVIDVDVETFLTAAEEAQVALRGGHPDTARALVRADELYGGDFLADDPYEDWAQPLREEAQVAHTSVLRALAQHASDTDQKLVYLMRLVHRDPYDEDAHLELVQVLRAAGRHGEAQRRYRTYVERMRELGIAPAGGEATDPDAGPAGAGGGQHAEPSAGALTRWRAPAAQTRPWTTELGGAHRQTGVPAQRTGNPRRLIEHPA
ncbi:BTAD domain-containing putative transcriptional regulator [Micromonospora sp. NPDC005237]|uniref:BTAD domain-containing putative transcriptional regulator n=1 Tax=unclassified Micromonospora TaxID=2617518 RepID=UPI0033ACD18B